MALAITELMQNSISVFIKAKLFVGQAYKTIFKESNLNIKKCILKIYIIVNSLLKQPIHKPGSEVANHL